MTMLWGEGGPASCAPFTNNCHFRDIPIFLDLFSIILSQHWSKIATTNLRICFFADTDVAALQDFALDHNVGLHAMKVEVLQLRPQGAKSNREMPKDWSMPISRQYRTPPGRTGSNLWMAKTEVFGNLERQRHSPARKCAWKCGQQITALIVCEAMCCISKEW